MLQNNTLCHKNIKRAIFIGIFTLTLAIFIPLQTLGMGIVSQPLVIENAIRGETIQDSLEVFNSEEAPVVFELSSEGDIAGWAVFYLPDDLENPITQISAQASSYVKSTVYINVPEDTANGEYQGQLTATLKPAETDDAAEGNTKVTILQRLSRQITINVTDNENAKLAVSVIPATYDIKNNQPLDIRFIYDNQGNISLSPQIDLKVYASNNKVVYNLIYPYPEAEEPIKPGEIREISSISLPTTDLKDGSYRAEMKFLHQGNSILTEDFRFNVGQAGQVAGAFNLNYKIFWPLVGGVVIIVFVVIMLVALKRIKIPANKK